MLTQSRHQRPDHQSRGWSASFSLLLVPSTRHCYLFSSCSSTVSLKSFCLQNVICKHNTNSSKILRSSALYLGCRSYLAKCALSQVSLAAATPTPSPPHNLVLDAFFIVARLGRWTGYSRFQSWHWQEKGWEKKRKRKRLNFETFISFRTIGVIASGEREHGQRMLSPRERAGYIVIKVGQLALDNRVRFKYSSLLCAQPRAQHGICKWWRLGRRGTK